MSVWLSILIILLTFYIMSEVVDKYFIKSLDNIAAWLKMPPSVAGATLLAFGTSAPEISTALVALFLDGANPATGIGTIVGSAIFQMLVVIGFAAAVRTSTLNWRPVIRDGIFYALSILLLIWFIADDKIELWEACGFVGAYVVYLIVMFFWVKYVKEEDPRDEKTEDPAAEEALKPRNPFMAYLMKAYEIITWPVRFPLSLMPDPEKKEKWTIPVFLISLSIIGYACFWMVIAAEAFAGSMGIAPAIIALTILAGGSSVPEMISSAIVSKQGRGDMAIANAVGSNIFDILMSLGLPVLIYILVKGHDLENLGGANVSSSILLLFASLLTVILLLAMQRFRATRPFGIFLIVLYIIYVVAAYTGWIEGGA